MLTYFGSGRCLLKIPLKYRDKRGWFDILPYTGIIAALERALLATQIPLYIRPPLYIL